MFPLLHAIIFTLCLVSIAHVSTATCWYVYVVSSKLNASFHCFMLLCLRCLVSVADEISIFIDYIKII